MIETKRLILRLMYESDFDDMLRVLTDPSVMKSFSLGSFSREEMRNWMERNLNHQDRYGYGLYSVILKSNQELMGDCGLEHAEFEGQLCVEIGYDLLSKYWNQGYATEAARAVRDHAIEKLNIAQKLLCCFIRRPNRASQRVAEKIGMHRVKRFEKNGIEYFLYAFSHDYSPS